MQTYVFQRLLQVLLVLFGVSTMMFSLLRLSGDPVTLFISDNATAEELERLRESLGFNDPIVVQYVRFVGDLLTGDFGLSFRAKIPARDLVLQRLPATLQLAAAALLVGTALAIPAGILAAVRRGTVLDTLVTGLLSIGQSVPIFLVGFILILLLAVRLNVLPTSGRGEFRHLVLPSLTLGLFFMARIARVTRSSVLEVISQEFVVTARSKGLAERVILVVHILRNAALPIVTIMGHLLATVISGAIVTEAVFAWPGIGSLMVDAVRVRDFPVVQACVFILAIFVALSNLITDITYAILDPRVRLQ
jgi:peptide/nickel transport system permease protein